jgi:hypothetical protein
MALVQSACQRSDEASLLLFVFAQNRIAADLIDHIDVKSIWLNRKVEAI